jgi:hypothetical protein
MTNAATNAPTTAQRAIDECLRTRKIVTIPHDGYQFGLLCQESKDRDVMAAEGAKFWGVTGGREWCVVMQRRS